MKKTVFYLITDSHLVSHDIWVEGDPINGREKGDVIALKATPEILDTFIEKILADREADTVLFTGDNVNNGDMASHRDFRERLDRLKAAGKNVYVTTATHDYCGEGDDENFFHACRYTATGTEDTPFMRKSGLFDFYAAYGPEQALSVHRESGSYTVQIGEGVRLIAINDNGNGRSHCGLFEDGVKWLTEQIDEANAAGELVLLAVHHPVLPPWEVYRHMVDFEMYGGYRELWKLICEKKVRVVFTGHTHVQNIRKYTDEADRWFLDVSTIALANAAGKMRRVEVDPETGMCSISSIGIDSISGIDTGGKTAFEYLYGINMPGIVERLLPLAEKDFGAFLKEARGALPVEMLEKHKAAAGFALKKLAGMKLSAIGRFGRNYARLTKEERPLLKTKPLVDFIYVILRHVFTGNAPFTPDTPEYKAVMGAAKRLDRVVRILRIKQVQGMIPPGSSLAEIAEDFLYNNRTGDDDAVRFPLC